jgi:alpha-amylase
MKLLNKKPLLAALMAAGLFASMAVQAAPKPVYVNLFEWQYTDIALECTKFLGPMGFGAVQISVPTESIANNGHWYERYQPVSYKLDSRLGTRGELQTMVSTCRTAGVAIYSDVVMNHMANGTGTGESGSAYQRANSYPVAGYTAADFHSECNVDDRSAQSIHDCWIGLPDLKTESANVRTKLGNYLKDLLSLGIAGFRVDAEKHIPANDIVAILNIAGNVNAATGATFGMTKPWVTGEIRGFSAIGQAERDVYFSFGTVNEFQFEDKMRAAFDHRGSNIAQLRGILPVNTTDANPSGLFASTNATVFVCNHDGERRDECMNIDYGKMFNLGNVFMLAYPYGQPQLQSGFKIPGPAGDGAGQKAQLLIPGTKIYNTSGVPDFTKWDHQHRFPEIANMVEFRNQTESTKRVDDWTTNGTDRISFHRGDRGFLAINRDDFNSWVQNVKTGMAPGQYCNVINGLLNAAKTGCTGSVITVKPDSTVDLNIASMSTAGIPAVAIHAGQKVGGGCSGAGCGCTTVPVKFRVANANTVFGQDVYAAGNLSQLGTWTPTTGNHLTIESSGAKTPWSRTIDLPPSTAFSYKFMKHGAVADVWEADQSAAVHDRQATSQACGAATLVLDVGNFKF